MAVYVSGNKTYIENLALFRVSLGEGLVDQPAAFVIHNISADLSNKGGIAITVEIIILNLEIFTKRDQDILSFLESGLVLDTSLV